MPSPTPSHPPDLSDPDAFNSGFPHDFFRYLRATAPVYWHARNDLGGDGFFVVSRHADVKYVSQRPEMFCSGEGITLGDASAPGDPAKPFRSSIIFMDPPEHIRYRQLVSGAFKPARLAALEARIGSLADAIIDGVIEKGACDFVLDVAAELPLAVISEFVGVPQGSRRRLFEASNKMVGVEDPEYSADEGSAQEAAADLYMLSSEMVQARQRQLRDDIISQLMSAEVDGERLSEHEFNAFFVILVIAGNETTRNQTAQGLRLLMEHPEQQRRLIEDPGLLDSAVEEMLRFNPPVHYFRRTATADLELAGTPIKKGQSVALYYPSANRDERVFEDPDRFDVARHPNPHLSFGIGEHFCLGARLARIQLRAMFAAVLRRMPDIRPAGETRFLRSHIVDGIKRMPVRFSPDRRRSP